MTVAYTFGWRKPEVLDLKKHQYNSQDETLRLDPGTTKNGEGRVVKLTSELRAMPGGLGSRDRAKAERVIPWLFPHLEGARRAADFGPAEGLGVGSRPRWSLMGHWEGRRPRAREAAALCGRPRQGIAEPVAGSPRWRS